MEWSKSWPLCLLFFIFYPLSRTPPNNNHCQNLLWKHHRPPKSQLYIDSNLINTAVDSCQTEVRRSNYLHPYQVIGWVGWEQSVHHGNHKEALSNSGGYSIEYLHHSYPHLIFWFLMIKRPFWQSVLGDSHDSVFYCYFPCTQARCGAGVCLSCLGVRAGLRPGQVTCLLQGPLDKPLGAYRNFRILD